MILMLRTIKNLFPFFIQKPVVFTIGFLLLSFFSEGVVHAQWYKKLTSVQSRLARVTAAPALQTQLSRTVDRTVHQQRCTQATHIRAPLASSVLKMREADWVLRFFSMQGTAFVLEETYQGKKYLWGITATHYLYQQPAVQLPGTHKFFRVPFVIQSSAGRGDVSLFPLPAQLAGKVTALKLAALSPQPGDELHSVGFFNKKLQLDEHRIVQTISPDHLITSLRVDPEISREGACGGPVLNEQQEVVGLHVGSSVRQQIGYAVPLEHIRYALQAYHDASVNPQPLIYDGVTLGTIGINEYIKSVTFYNQDQKESFSLFHKTVDYTHLEMLAEEMHPDKIVFSIEQNPLSSTSPDQEYYIYTLIYDLQTGQITRTPRQPHDL